MPTKQDVLNKISQEALYMNGYIVIESDYNTLAVHTAFYFAAKPEFNNETNRWGLPNRVRYYVCLLNSEEKSLLDGATLFQLSNGKLTPLNDGLKVYRVYKNPLVDNRFVAKMTIGQITELITLYNNNPNGILKLQILYTVDGLLIVSQYGDVVYKGYAYETK